MKSAAEVEKLPMTDKQNFLERLEAALRVRGASDSDIEPYIRQFERYYDRMVSDSDETEKALDDVENIADNIIRQISERYEEIDRLAASTLTVDAVKDDTADAGEIYEDDLYGDLELAEDETIENAIVPSLDDGDASEVHEYTGEAVRLPEYESREPVPNTTVFWVLFCAALPITLPFAAVGLSLFAAMWLAVIFLITAAIAALIAVCAAGAAATLVGVIYGVIQLNTSVALGVYEIGLGVIAAGCTLFIGILLYNLAVRLLPKLIVLIYRLFKYVLGQLKRLFDHLRRESAKL